MFSRIDASPLLCLVSSFVDHSCAALNYLSLARGSSVNISLAYVRPSATWFWFPKVVFAAQGMTWPVLFSSPLPPTLPVLLLCALHISVCSSPCAKGALVSGAATSNPALTTTLASHSDSRV
ncbi:uncharacterized protein IWZ02DRAFT_299886 [Phyllosticta citriasiana]|uniref:uncharacterized protein n=1 Tax=Phyllosticta citriasiana TaxID=595635 RepID=UPI0030FD36E6